MAEQTTSPVAEWSARLSAAGTPVFTRTVRQISAVSSDVDASARDLSAVVSQDASMTARLLRIANSPIFNPQQRPVDTVSAAVIMLGFDVVRELSVSLALIEQVLTGRPHSRVTQGLARAFHAAAQAKSFARLRRDRSPEEVFVAALLFQVGEMAFWSADAAERDRIEQLIAAGLEPEKAERRILGFSLRDLSRKLAVDWSLGDLLRDTLDGKVDSSGRSSNIALGHSLAKAIETHGMQAPETLSVVRRLGAHLEIPVEQVQSLVTENLEDALRIARSYGVTRLETVLPVTQTVAAEEVLAGHSADAEAAQLQSGSAADRQLMALIDLAGYVEAGEVVDALMRRLISGLHESVGFDRTWFALLTPDRRSLQAKYVFGHSPEDFEGAKRPLRGPADFFQSIIDSGRAGRFHPGDKAAEPANLGWLAVGECLCMPVSVNGKPLGVLYGDKSRSRVPLDDLTLGTFRLFGSQIPMLLMMARKSA